MVEARVRPGRGDSSVLAADVSELQGPLQPEHSAFAERGQEWAPSEVALFQSFEEKLERSSQPWHVPPDAING